MTELLTAAQMRAIEAAAIASGEVTGLELMERAGRGVVEAIFEEWPELRATSHRAVVLCGPGNNGGDGFVVARLLKEWGWEVEVFLYGDPGKLPPDARANYQRWRAMGEVASLSVVAEPGFPGCDLAVDALFGTGLARPLGEDLATVLGNMAIGRGGLFPFRVVAVDMPSGLCSDSGRALYAESEWTERFVRRRPGSDLCVTFERPRRGHYLGEAPNLAGKLRVVSLGIHHEIDGPLHNSPTPVTELAEPWIRILGKVPKDHKYTLGHALILSGPPGHTGAARLAGRGALRIGAGLVTVGAMPEAIPEHAARLDAVMLRPVADAAALAEALQDRRITALCLGPGLGLDDHARALVAAALGLAAEGPPPPSPPHGGEGRHSTSVEGAEGDVEALPLPLVGRGEGWGATRPTVLDADALTLLSRDPGLFAALHDACILTPHAGEFARLFPDIAEKLAAPATKGPAFSKVDATRAAAKRAGCVVLYKGPDTVIADPSGHCSINSAHYDRTAPWLATAGAGDVLSGFIAGLLARGFAPMQAAETAAWLHVECARKFGPGLIAEDLPEQLPAVFRDLGL
jgi:hydroxyethylthiazole kinase-like uncharacterized protein yjeF